MPQTEREIPKPVVGLRIIDPAHPTILWTVAQYDGAFADIYLRRDHDGKIFHRSLMSWDRAWTQGHLQHSAVESEDPDEYTRVSSDAIASVFWDFENLSEATTLSRQAGAFIELANSVSDLVSWHPKFDIETGQIARPEGED